MIDLKVNPELTQLFNVYLAHTGTRNQEMASDLLVAHLILENVKVMQGVRDDLKRLEQLFLAEPSTLTTESTP